MTTRNSSPTSPRTTGTSNGAPKSGPGVPGEVEKHMIVTATTEVYIATAWGQLRRFWRRRKGGGFSWGVKGMEGEIR